MKNERLAIYDGGKAVSDEVRKVLKPWPIVCPETVESFRTIYINGNMKGGCCMQRIYSKTKRMPNEEEQGESRVRENFMYGRMSKRELECSAGE